MRYVAIALLLLLPVLAAAGEWHSEYIDEGYVGESYFYSCTLVLDWDDHPHITSIEAHSGDEYYHYYYWNGSSWETQLLDNGQIIGVDQNNKPLFSWRDSKNIYYRHLDVDYNVYTSPYNIGSFTAEVNSAGLPHFVFYERETLERYQFNWYLTYVYHNGSSWVSEIVDVIIDGPSGMNDLDLHLDSAGEPHIVYTYEYQDRDWYRELRYAHRHDSTWDIEVVDSDVRRSGISLELDSQINPVFSYIDWVEDGLKYAYKEDDQWYFKLILTDADLLDCRMELDANEMPCIAYLNYDVYTNLSFVYNDADEWVVETVDDTILVEILDYSLELDSNYQPKITYPDGNMWMGSYVTYAWRDNTIFHLIWPENEEEVQTTTPTLDWENCTLPNLESYTLWWGTDPDFNDYNEVTDIAESEYQITEGIEDGDRIYWRVKSIDVDEEEYWAVELDWYFDVDLIYFHLLSPESGEVVDTLTPLLDWEDSPVPDHESYTLWWGTDPDFETYNEVTDIVESEYQIADGIQDGDRIWWRVKSIDVDEEEYWAVEMDWYFDVDLGGGVDIVDFVVDAEDEGILVNWRIEGDSPSGLRVLRTIGDEEPIFLHSEPLNGDATKYLDRGVSSGVEYCYWLEVTETDGTVTRFGPTDTITVPEYIPELILYAAYPNPSREVINFVFSLPDEGRVKLSVYDLSGRRIATLVSSDLTAGRHEVSWSCSAVSTGVYLCRLETGAGSITQRLVIAR